MYTMTKVAFVIKGSLTDSKLMSHLEKMLDDGYLFTTNRLKDNGDEKTLKPKAVEVTVFPAKIKRRSNQKGTHHFRSSEGTAETHIENFLKKNTVGTMLQIGRHLHSIGFAKATGYTTLNKMRAAKRVMIDEKNMVMINPN
jgi:hypothetical protein